MEIRIDSGGKVKMGKKKNTNYEAISVIWFSEEGYLKLVVVKT